MTLLIAGGRFPLAYLAMGFHSPLQTQRWGCSKGGGPSTDHLRSKLASHYCGALMLIATVAMDELPVAAISCARWTASEI